MLELNIEYRILRINFEACLKAKFKTKDKSKVVRIEIKRKV
jgi:hypothetical protein